MELTDTLMRRVLQTFEALDGLGRYALYSIQYGLIDSICLPNQFDKALSI